jgi:hypothetical protein
VTDKFANIVMDLSFLSLVLGGLVFVWAEQTRVVALSVTVAVAIALIGFVFIALVAPEDVP